MLKSILRDITNVPRLYENQSASLTSLDPAQTQRPPLHQFFFLFSFLWFVNGVDDIWYQTPGLSWGRTKREAHEASITKFIDVSLSHRLGISSTLGSSVWYGAILMWLSPWQPLWLFTFNLGHFGDFRLLLMLLYQDSHQSKLVIGNSHWNTLMEAYRWLKHQLQRRKLQQRRR